MRHMVAQVRHDGAEGIARPQRNRKEVVRLLRAGHTMDEVAYVCNATRREIRRIAKREGLA